MRGSFPPNLMNFGTGQHLNWISQGRRMHSMSQRWIIMVRMFVCIVETWLGCWAKGLRHAVIQIMRDWSRAEDNQTCVFVRVHDSACVWAQFVAEASCRCVRAATRLADNNNRCSRRWSAHLNKMHARRRHCSVSTSAAERWADASGRVAYLMQKHLWRVDKSGKSWTHPLKQAVFHYKESLCFDFYEGEFTSPQWADFDS